MRPTSSVLPECSPTGSRKARIPWKRLVAAAGVFFTLIWIIGPHTKEMYFGDGSIGVYDSAPSSAISEAAAGHLPPLDNSEDAPHVPNSNEYPTHDNTPSSLPTSQHPTSSKNDPDRAGTTYCAKPHTSSKPLVQYALMIDAGSQGSRIHVYKFNTCLPSLTLEYEVFIQKKGGLSAYAADPQAAAKSLDSLMDTALESVPISLQKCTPVAVKATAGLRLLGTSASAAILDAVRHRLATKYPFELPTTTADGLEDRVAIMDGKDEGVYAWITSNYLLKTIGPGVSSAHSYAVLDLGGASTQIVFEPTFVSDTKEKFIEGEHKYALTFAGKKYTLYQHSYLGYGLMRARESVHSLVTFLADQSSSNQPPTDLSPQIIMNSCLSRGTSRLVQVPVTTSSIRNIMMQGSVHASFAECQKLITMMLAKDAPCRIPPCAFNGAYQPSILETFPKGGILALSYFTDRLQPFIKAGLIGVVTDGKGEHAMKISDIQSLAQKVCLGPDSWKTHFAPPKTQSQMYTTLLKDELEGRPEACLDLTYMHTILEMGYEFDKTREVRLEKQVGGVELGWALGAGLALLDAQISCRV